MGIGAARLLAPLALLMAPAWEGRALAFTPAEVVAAAPESERSLRQAAEVAAAARGLRLAEAGTDASLRLEPALSYGADVEDPAALAGSFDLGVALGWRYDRVERRKAAADLLYARERLRHWRRADVRDALRLLGATLRAEVALQRAELDLQRSRESAAGGGRGERDAAVLRAQALVAARRHALASLRAKAAKLGFPGEPRLEAAAFTLPPAPEAPPARQRLTLELEAARLARDRAAVFEVLRGVSLDATYESKTARFQVSGSLALDRGRPSVGLGGEVGNQEDDQWSLRLSADIRLGTGTADARAADDERVRRAEAELASLDAGYAGRVREALTGVEDARAALAAELAAWREEVAGPAAAGAAAGPPTLSASSCRALLARENAVYGAWLEVVSASYAYLETVDGAWAVAPVRAETAPPRPPGAVAARAPAARPPATGADGRAGGRADARADGSADAWPVRPSACATPPPRPLTWAPRTRRSRPAGA